MTEGSAPGKQEAVKPGSGVEREPPPVSRASFYSELPFRLWVVGMAGMSLVFMLQSYYPSYIGPVSNVLPAAGAALAFASAALCWRRYGFGLSRRFDAVWFCFALGTGMWVVAEVTWAVYYFVLDIPVPYPSVADLFYAGGYFPLLVGLALYLGAFSVALSGWWLAGAVVSIAIVGAVALGLELPTELSRGLSPVNTLSDLAYPILDLALFSLTAFSLAIFLGGAISKWWILFGGASLLYVVGDEYFLFQIAVGTYYNGSVDDLFFILGYLTFALAFYAHRREF